MQKISLRGEHWRSNLIGQIYTPQLERAASQKHSLESQLIRADMQKRLIRQKLRGCKVALLPSLYEGVMCTLTDPKTNKILEVAFNTPEDLILNNFGSWLASFIRQPQTTQVQTVFTDSANSAQTFGIWGYAAGFNGTYAGGNSGTKIKVGSSTTAANRADYNVGTAFVAAPENASFATGAGSFSSGAISFSGAITAGGNGTVNETSFWGVWPNQSSQIKEVMLFHDILGEGFPFTIGQTINVAYTISL